AAPPPVAVVRDVVLAAGPEARDAQVRAGYEAVAAGYARELADELAHKPFDRWLLDRVAADADGPVADVGTGPGHVAARLAASGAAVVGVDLSPAMIEEARNLFPDLEFEVGNLTNLLRPRAAAGWSAITAWYAFVHMAPSELPAVIGGLARILVPGGRLAFALHVGAEVRHVDELFGAPVDLDFVLHNASEVLEAVTAAGLVDVEWYLRSPLPDVETPTDRLYVLAHRAP
ncbi:MAG: class I SAM-dependent DNA methyltransferase, partial [Pseudonocardia sp.]